MIQPAGSNFNIRATPQTGVSAHKPIVQLEESDEALEQFLTSWTSGAPGTDQLSLDQMLKIQATNSEVPQLPAVTPTVQNPTDHALRQIEMLVHQNRSIFQNAARPRGMTDGWNIAGQR